MPLGELFLGTFLRGFFNVLIDRLTSPELVQFLRQEGFETKIDKWGRTLEIINALLADAEEKQLTDRAVKIWMDDLEELAYDVEDMLDEFEYEATARKIQMAEYESSKLWKHVPTGFCNWSLGAIRFRFHMRSKVNDVTTRFNELSELRGQLGLQVNAGGTASRSSAAPQRPPTSSLQTGAVYGRDAEKETILEMVLKSEPNDSNILVIPIVGMGGVGKTTLAREVYNHHKAVESFDVKAWICVSDGDFDVTRISMLILKNISDSASDQKDFGKVQKELKQRIDEKRFLLVLDDVWSVSHGDWEILLSPFTQSALGSRIIVTTRIEDVALTLRPTCFHKLDLLQDEDCWLVFSMCAFENGTIQEHLEIELIRDKVIEKSNGLPLAAKTLGGLLRSKKIDEWLEILNSKLWDLSEEEGSKILTVLKLSYHHLPFHLRRCFAYCAIFPKDHEFKIEEVVFLWIAEGLVQQSAKNEQLEELGSKYFFDLLGRSMFQQSSSTKGHVFVMHDLIHDLAQWAFGERSLRLDGVSTTNRQLGGLKNVRHFSYTSERYDDEKRFKVFLEDGDLRARIRTFLSIPQDDRDKFIVNLIPFDLLSKLKQLRALSLQRYCFAKVDVSITIEGLKHLRYLNLSGTNIRSLPESISLLYNLQILLLRNCFYLLKLPSNFKYLIKLRHLDIEGANLIKMMPLGMKCLKDLQKLSNFVVGKGVGSSLKDLICLKMLHGKLCIMKLDNMIDCDGKDLILSDKKDLKVLLLEWKSQFEESRNEAREEKVLDMLQPHENLQKLIIKYYGGTKFSHWVGSTSYSKVKVLRLEDCEKCTYLPSLGVLMSLEELTIQGMKALTHIGFEFYGKDQSKPFKLLKTLNFENLPVWADWEPIEENEYCDAFPCLIKLSIKTCPQLSGSLPKRLLALEELVIKKCEQLVVSFSNIPKLCQIEIDGCKRIACDNPVEFKSIRYLELSNISEFSNQLMQECFGKAELQQIKHNACDEICPEKPPVAGLQSIRFLTKLVISHCSNIVSFHEVCSLPHLSKLQIRYCNALISLPEEMNINNACLESLEIKRCDSLIFIVRGQLPPSLKNLKVTECKKLESLWDDREDYQNTNSSLLERLEISKCDSLAFIVRGQLPPSLKRLEISECEKLESLWDDREGSCSSVQGKENGINTNSSVLEYLSVVHCPSLTCLSSIIQLPATLKHLRFYECAQLSTIAERFLDSNMSLEVIEIKYCKNLQIPNGLQNLRHLRDLRLTSCPTIEFFPEEVLADTNLTKLRIFNCEKLSALPIGLRSLNSLEDLAIHGCPRITSFNPEEVLPTNLKYLSIGRCENVYRSLVEWRLQNFTSLTSLWLWECPHMESFPQQEMGMTLPSSLVDLYIKSFQNLKQLWSHGFQNLTSLRDLTIDFCPNLTSLGDEGLPSSLEFLRISYCPNLTYFPKQGLPSSLHLLHITACPKLKKECKRNKGREWSEISNILQVEIRDGYTFDLEEDEEPQPRHCLTNPMRCCKSTSEDTLDGNSTLVVSVSDADGASSIMQHFPTRISIKN